MSTGYPYFKRAADVLTSLLLLIGLSWVFVFLFIIYHTIGERPVFFIQRRIGKNEKIFNLYKFRTLSVADQSLQERRFWLGDVLRFLSLDELPQLINILKGDMSLVGPRPLPEKYMERFSADERKRHAVLPGITGWAQINGRNSITWKEKFNLDLYYVRNQSLWLDLTIILKTIILLISFRKDNSLNESEFTGSSNE